MIAAFEKPVTTTKTIANNKDSTILKILVATVSQFLNPFKLFNVVQNEGGKTRIKCIINLSKFHKITVDFKSV